MMGFLAQNRAYIDFDVLVFRNMALICVGVGGFLSLFVFHLTVRVKEVDSEKYPTEKVRSK